MQKLVELIDDPALIVDTRGMIIAANDLLLNMFGYERNEIISEDINLLVPESVRTKHKDYVKSFIDNHEKHEFDYLSNLKGAKKDGTTVNMNVLLMPIPVRNTVIVLAVIRNLDKMRQVTEKLHRMLDKLNKH